MNFFNDPPRPWSVPVVLVVALLLVAITLWTYRGTGASRRRILFVLSLRLLALLLAFAAVLRPALAFHGSTTEPSTLLIAVDDSESMTIQDEPGNKSRWDRLQQALAKCEPELRRLQEDAHVTVSFHRFAADVRDFDPKDPGTAAGNRSDYGTMLQTLLDRSRGERNLRGLVVLGDGGDNGTRYQPLDVAKQWRNLPAPIHTFGFGNPNTADRQQDVALTSIVVDPSPVPVGGKMTVRATADAPGFENKDVTAQLLLNGLDVTPEAERKQRLRLTRGNEIRVVVNAPAQDGDVKVTLKIEPFEDEVEKKNNEISTFVAVVREGIRVLVIDRVRAHEPRFLHRALDDPRLHLTRVFLGGAEIDPAVRALLNFREQQYDVFLIGDVTPGQILAANPDALTLVAEQVNKRGAGLLLMGGYNAFAAGGWDKTPLAELLPVKMDTAGVLDGETALRVTPEGKDHFVLRLDPDAAESQKLWNALPPLIDASRMGRLRENLPSGSVLLGTNETPLLAVRKYGEGRTMTFAGQDTWRWVQPPNGQRVHSRFWRQLVLWLANQENSTGSVWVKPDARRLAAGGPLSFTVGVRGKGGLDLKDGRFEAKVTGPDGVSVPVKTVRDRDEDRGTFYKTDAPGEYTLTVEGHASDTDGSKVDGTATARFLIYQDDTELARRAADHEFLKRLAAVSSGQFHAGDEEELRRFLRDLPSQPVAGLRPKANLWPDWQRNTLTAFPPLLLLFFVGFLGAEWFLRRRWGMV